MTKTVTLTTDFGLTDHFVGVMHGVIAGIAPGARVIDITHGIAAQDVRQGAFVLANSVPYFPTDCVHVCVVDPGVGSPRRALAAAVGETLFVAPDNGVLSPALDALAARDAARPLVVALDRPQFWLERVSTTFHGRDIFAPTAAHLANGVPLTEVGTPITDWVTLPSLAPERLADGSLRGRVIYIDHFGNLITDISARDLESLNRAQLVVRVRDVTLSRVHQTYAAVAAGELLALVSSGDMLEIARRDGSAAASLAAQVGDTVTVALGE